MKTKLIETVGMQQCVKAQTYAQERPCMEGTPLSAEQSGCCLGHGAWLDRSHSSSCAERSSHVLTPTSFELLQYTTSKRGRHWTLKEVAIFAHLKYTWLCNWGLGPEQGRVPLPAVSLREGEGPGSLVRGGWTPTEALFIADCPIVFYGWEGHICP